MRPEILFPLYAPLDSLPGVGPKLKPVLEKLAGPKVRDLLDLSPHSVLRRPRRAVGQTVDGELATVLVVVDQHQPPTRANLPWRIRVRDDTGFLHLVFFKTHGDHLARNHPVGALRAASGRVEHFNAERQMAHPDYLLAGERLGEIPEVEPVYPAAAGAPPRTVRRIVAAALARAPELAEWLEPALLEREGWPGWRQALGRLHAPQGEQDLDGLAPHRRRLAYDELLAHQLAMARRLAARRRRGARPLPASALAGALEAALPFRLTEGQRRVLGEIRADLAGGQRMSRLLQGDVGSGKTAVALLAMADAVEAGGQAALMAPTEILARQHGESLIPTLAAQGVEAVLLTGRDKGAGRAAKLSALADGRAAVAIGTHALFQDDVRFHDLRLAVIDEQHRFGVAERGRLTAKGEAVHLLGMSATPIPRSLQLAQFGDLDVSTLREKPPGRTPVATRLASLDRLGEVFTRLRQAVEGGAQAFWVCPLVAESETVDLQDAESRAADLRRLLGPAAVGLAHGRLTPGEKDAVMLDFAEGRRRVLVATTVIEVGVNVPAATIMVVEHPERFGLAQLHQLRGRVGRGKEPGACLLLYDPALGEAAQERLLALRDTDDGFVLAEKDLEQRGYGDVLGAKQSGDAAYALADLSVHADLLEIAGKDARHHLARDPELRSPRGEALRLLAELHPWRAEADLTDAG